MLVVTAAIRSVQDAMAEIAEPLDTVGELLRTEGPRFLGALVVFVGVGLLGVVVAATVSRILDRTGRAGRYSRVVRRLIRWTMGGLGLVMALHVLGMTAIATSMLATGGVVAVILGFAFKDIGENLLAGIFLAFSRSFDVGDLIESGGLQGVVRSIDLRDTHIRTADGCDIFIPSASIFRNPLLNFTRDGLRRGSFTVGIDYRDDPERALGLLEPAVLEADWVLHEPPPVLEISGLAPSWVEIRVHFWVDTFSGGGLVRGGTAAMAACRRVLIENGFTVSSEVTTAVALPPLEVSLERTPGTRDGGTGGPTS
jgi:small-conductance mechanosensitive channel